MPTIHLQHVTKRYDTGKHELDALEKTIAASAHFFESDAHTYATHSQVQHETPDRTYALNNFSLVIKNGETLSVLGPSGCGKTTLLKVIAGLTHPEEGDVLYDGVPIKDIPMDGRGIGMVFQGYALYPHMEAYYNIGFHDLVHKHPEKIPERIQHVSTVMGVDIKYLLSRKPPTLSGGEQQRVAVARCLARDPKLFLFDEPLSNLDAKLRTETRFQLHRLLRHYSITSVYVTHDQAEAIALADRIAIMRDGKIEQIGTFQSLYDTPLNAFVAEFFGTPPMNLFSGHIFGDQWEGSGISVKPVRPGLTSGQAVWLGIRPEHIQITAEGIPAVVDFVESILTQQRQLIYLNIGKQPCVVSTTLDAPAHKGETLHLAFPSEHLYLFDKNTNARIG